MSKLNLQSFPANIVQQGIYYCIPASIEAMIKYLDTSYNINQVEIMNLMVIGAKDNSPSFNAAENFVTPRIKPHFELKQMNPNTFAEWKKTIKDEIDSGRPIAISTRTNNGVHIRVVVGYNDTKKHFTLFNPGFTNIQPNKSNGNRIHGLTLIIQSGLEEYKFNKAKSDWNKKDSCKDQLIII